MFSAWRLFFSFLALSSSVETLRPSVSFCSSVLWMIAMSSLIPEMSGEQNWPEPGTQYVNSPSVTVLRLLLIS